MQTIFKRKYFTVAGVLVGLMLLWSACLKSSDSALHISHSAPFENGDIKKALATEPSISLFNKAFTRLQLAALVDSGKGYTVFAPVDSVMKAAGLDEQKINSLPLDSLRRLIAYHVVAGPFDDLALTNNLLSTKGPSFLRDTTFDQHTGFSVYTYPLFIRESAGVLWLNGHPIEKNAPVMSASNGYIYPVKRIVYAPQARSLYDIIATEPDLTLYNAAMQISDSLVWDGFQKRFGAYDQNTRDTFFYAHPIPPNLAGSWPTIFAPTNKAFNKAGFYTVEDIRSYALSTPTGVEPGSGVFRYPPIDSLITRHVLFNSQLSFQNSFNTSLVLYGDLLDKHVDLGPFNIYWGRSTSEIYNGAQIKWPGMQFYTQNGKVYIQWGSTAVPVTLDGDMAHSVNSFIATNGALYKIDQLFYPIN
ncbi:fasciclin domain-containing protein [Chitinophaga agrisoli]|nr:fasciclin domain-containing protein [Chitinophaga agrisoli]